MARILKFLTVLALLLAGAPAVAVELGNAAAGLEYAQKVCSDCHAVEPDTAMLFSQVPSFQEVADTIGMTPRALVVWLTTSHPQYAGHHPRARRYGQRGCLHHEPANQEVELPVERRDMFGEEDQCLWIADR